MLDFDITTIIVAAVAVIGVIMTSKTLISYKDNNSKPLRMKIREMEEFQEYQKKQIRVYKNKVSNTERGPQIQGDIDELSDILPELVGTFSDYLPKWAQGFTKDPEMQKWIFNYVKENPDKAKQWFGKLMNKKGSVKQDEKQFNEEIGV